MIGDGSTTSLYCPNSEWGGGTVRQPLRTVTAVSLGDLEDSGRSAKQNAVPPVCEIARRVYESFGFVKRVLIRDSQLRRRHGKEYRLRLGRDLGVGINSRFFN